MWTIPQLVFHKNGGALILSEAKHKITQSFPPFHIKIKKPGSAPHQHSKDKPRNIRPCKQHSIFWHIFIRSDRHTKHKPGSSLLSRYLLPYPRQQAFTALCKPDSVATRKKKHDPKQANQQKEKGKKIEWQDFSHHSTLSYAVSLSAFTSL